MEEHVFVFKIRSGQAKMSARCVARQCLTGTDRLCVMRDMTMGGNMKNILDFLHKCGFVAHGLLSIFRYFNLSILEFVC